MTESKLYQIIDGFIFDLDGTVFLGERALPGAVETIQRLRSSGKRTLFVTNKPLYPREAYAEKLTRLGIPTQSKEVITSGFVMGYHLAMNGVEAGLYVIGEENLKRELASHGLRIIPEFEDQDPKEVIDPRGIGVVVVAFDRTLTYRKLNTAYQALIQGAAFYATNPDKTCPMPGGGIPDAGGTIAALEHLTGRMVDLLSGKPSELMVQVAMQTIDQSPERCMLVGDRLETDIVMGKRAGMHTALVLSGATNRKQATKSGIQADFILDSIGELIGVL